MNTVRFKQVDVFTHRRFKGNPVAVILEADGLTDAQMQQIANWTNLSETTFVVSKTSDEADYKVRIFTPGSELPFAGHPTIGTAHALIEAGLVTPRSGVLTQECGAGLVKLDVTTDTLGARRIAFELPTPKIITLTSEDIDQLETSLGSPILREFQPCLVDVGARWIVAQLSNAAAVLANRPDMEQVKIASVRAQATGVVIFGEYTDEGPSDMEVRAYAPACGVSEDPVCGSGNGAMAAFVRHTAQVEYFGEELQASQGQMLGRAGAIYLNIQTQSIKVGGEAITCVDGTVSLD